MNYQKIYNKLCERGKTSRNLEYCETHHIIPRCMGGNDESSNLTVLTYREHYIVHHLLTKIYPKRAKIHYAFLCMIRNSSGQRILTARMVETIKKNFSEFKKWHAKISNPMFSASAKKKLSDRMKANNPNIGGIWNHTAYPVMIEFEDGTTQRFEFMKDAANKLNVPYASMKVARRTNTSMKKYNIKKIIKIEE
jgi:superoxide dismutase